MRLDNVEIENLLSHKHTFVEYKADRIRIAGDNGAGKTSATVDAMLWALFGNARGATTDDLKGPWSNKMGCKVRFALNGKDYEVHRERGSSSALFLRNLTDSVDLSEKHISMTQEKIEELLGSENSFVNTVVFKQGDALRFAQMKPAERGALIDELTGIEGMAQLAKVAAQRSKAAENERQRLQSEIDRINNASMEVSDIEARVKTLDTELLLLDKEISKAEAEIEEADLTLNDVQSAHAQKSRLENEARQAEIEQVRAQNLYDQLEQKHQRLIVQQTEMESGESCPTCGSKLDVAHPHVHAKLVKLEEDIASTLKQVDLQRELLYTTQLAKRNKDKLLTTADTQITQKFETAQRMKASAGRRALELAQTRKPKTEEQSRLSGQVEILRRDIPKLPQLEADIEVIKRRIRGFDLIAEAFSKRGIPRELKRSFVAEIEKGANALLIGLSPFTVRLSLEKDGVQKSGVTEGTMDVWVKDSVLERKVEMLSGGEKMRVMLAVRLATAQAMAKKHERAIKTLIIDEALDGLDTAGKDAAVSMIQSLTNFDRILFITHDPAISSYFPEQLYFAKLADGSSAII